MYHLSYSDVNKASIHTFLFYLHFSLDVPEFIGTHVFL